MDSGTIKGARKRFDEMDRTRALDLRPRSGGREGSFAVGRARNVLMYLEGRLVIGEYSEARAGRLLFCAGVTAVLTPIACGAVRWSESGSRCCACGP